MYKKNRLHKNEEGQSLVEFALLLPILMIILLGIVEFGFMLNAKITLNSAAREGARVYAISNATGEVDKAVNNAAGYLGPISSDDIEKTYGNLEGSSGIKMANINITKDVPFLTNFFDLAFGNTIKMESSASMRVEYQLAETGG